jgi:predicted aminopeptidase
MIRIRHCTALLLAAAVLALGGCASPAYYLQAFNGQMELLRLARPIAEVQDDAAVPPDVKAKLAAAVRIRDFASRELALPDNGSYRKYADIGRPFVVWNVFAAEEFSVRPKEWCYPVAGCANYRGYFARADAEAYAARLRGQGFEVYVGGVPAYSTLGWFDDPLLSTYIHYPAAGLARIVFHELAHQVLYVRDDTEFNESFAVAVEQEGLRRWLAQENDPAQQAAFQQAQRMRADFQGLVLDARQRLEALYASARAPDDKRREKASILAGLRRDYAALKAGPWQEFAGFDRWFGQEINNATLASVGLYQQLVPAFEALLARDNRDLPRFYAAVKQLAALPKEARRELLARKP